MTDTETAPDVAPAKVARRVPAAQPDQPTVPAEPPIETAVAAAPADPVVPEPAPAVEPAPALARRAKRTSAVTVPWESALPGVRSSEIRAELARREKRTGELLVERERIVAELDAMEGALDAIGEDAA